MAALLAALSLLASSQEGALDVLDGETLYEDGWLLTAGYEFRTRRGCLTATSGSATRSISRSPITPRS